MMWPETRASRGIDLHHNHQPSANPITTVSHRTSRIVKRNIWWHWVRNSRLAPGGFAEDVSDLLSAIYFAVFAAALAAAFLALRSALVLSSAPGGTVLPPAGLRSARTAARRLRAA